MRRRSLSLSLFGADVYEEFSNAFVKAFYVETKRDDDDWTKRDGFHRVTFNRFHTKECLGFKR